MQKRPINNGIDWEMLDREKFEAATNVLLVRKHRDAVERYAPNDSGGDGGIDFFVRYTDSHAAAKAGFPFRGARDECVIIYQYKYYPDGLVASNRSRMKQVRDSLTKAIDAEPDYWVLVIPGLFKTGVMDDIGRRASAAGVQAKFLARPDLDSAMIAQPDLINFYGERDSYLTRLIEIYNAEVATLSHVSDVSSRALALAATASDLDPHWGVSIEATPGQAVTRLYAKHSEAARMSPIRFTPSINLDVLSTEDRDDFRRVMGMGESGTVKIHGEALIALDYDGPDWLRPQGKPESIWLILDGAPEDLPATLTCRAEPGRSTGEYPATIKDRGFGFEGHYLVVDLKGVVQMKITDPKSGEPALSLSISAAGKDPSDVKWACETFLSILSSARATLSVDQGDVLTFALRHDQAIDDIRLLAAAAGDLIEIQKHTTSYFAFPTDVEQLDIMYWRAYRLALEGHCVLLPKFSFNVTIEPDISEESLALAEGGAVLLVNMTEPALRIGTRTLPLPGGLVCFLPDARVDNMSNVAQRLRDEGVPQTVVARSPNNEPVRLYFPDLLRKGEQDQLVPTKWNLPGIPELPSSVWEDRAQPEPDRPPSRLMAARVASLPTA